MKLNQTGTLESFINLERYVNNGSPSGFTLDKFLDAPYLPSSAVQSFELPVIWLPMEQLVTVGDTQEYFDVESLDPDTLRVPYPIHPNIIDAIRRHPILSAGNPI